MTPELKLLKATLTVLKEMRKDIATLQIACVAVRNVLAEIDPKLGDRYKYWFAQASAVPKPDAQEQIDALIEEVLQITKAGPGSVH